MRARTVSLVVAAALVVTCATAAPGRAEAARPTASVPSPSPTPANGERRPSPGFILLLVVIVLGLVWQAQRTRRSTAQVSEHALDDFERRVRPEREVDPPPD
ncbi:MAG TPA: hypothetical protein VIG64_04875 [Actinomycetota bacterium]|jgi:hypothetical protein